MALDETGDTLRDAVQRMDLGATEGESVRLKTPTPRVVEGASTVRGDRNGDVSPASDGERESTSPMAEKAHDEEHDSV